MRTFIAINFDDEIKSKLRTVRDRIKTSSRSGNFVDDSNLHLTIRFIGEVSEEDMEGICMAIDEACSSFRSFDMTLNSVGFFPRGDKSIVWLGIEKNKSLEILFANLEKNLMRQGFAKERQGLTPHITIGREVVLKTSYDKLKAEVDMQPINIKVDSITLMESIRKGPRLIYKPVFVQKLK